MWSTCAKYSTSKRINFVFFIETMFQIIYSKGFGRRKLKTNAQGKFDPMFIGWIPKNIDRNQYIESTKTTSYAHDYNPNSTSPHMFSNLESTAESRWPPAFAPRNRPKHMSYKNMWNWWMNYFLLSFKVNTYIILFIDRYTWSSCQY